MTFVEVSGYCLLTEPMNIPHNTPLAPLKGGILQRGENEHPPNPLQRGNTRYCTVAQFPP